MRERVVAVLGISCLWAWLLVNNTVAATGSYPNYDVGFTIATWVIELAGCFLIYRWGRSSLAGKGQSFKKRLGVATFAVMLLACAVLVLCNYVLVDPPFALRLVSLVCRSAGTAMLLTLWYMRYSDLDSDHVAGLILVAVFLVMGVFLIERGLPTWVETLLNWVLPVLSAAFSVMLKDPADEAWSRESVLAKDSCPPLFWKGVFLYGVGCGVVLSVSMMVPSLNADHTIYSILVSPLVGVALIGAALWCAFVKRGEVANYSIIIVPIIVPVLLIIPYFNLGAADVSKIAIGTSLICFQALMAAIVPYYARRYETCSFHMAFKLSFLEEMGACAAIIVCSPFAAWLCGEMGFLQHASFLLTVVACVVSVVVIYALMCFILAKRSYDERQALEEQHQSAQDQICAKVSFQHALTSREQEVLRLLAAGRSQRYIQEVLVISEGTVRTHIKHVYQKLGVHSKQELIDLVDSKRSE
ncbi:MAG: hypothetical protein HFJ72_00445 [Adlercreutzia sp.]|nr:hypothetical protein [Adlercreutzia sp.]